MINTHLFYKTKQEEKDFYDTNKFKKVFFLKNLSYNF